MIGDALSWLLPPLPVAAALAVAVLKPLMLALYARVGRGRTSPGRRFVLVILTTTVLWFVILLAAPCHGELGDVMRVLDVSAGGAVLLTADLVLYSVWSLASYGFTVSMIRTLASSPEPLSLEEWAAAYGEGAGIARFAVDRAGVLTHMNLAYRTTSGVGLRRTARWLAVLLRGAAAVLAVDLKS